MYRLALILLLVTSVAVGQTLYYSAGACPSQMESNCQHNKNNLNFECTMGDFHLQVVGNQNVPKYTIWSGSDPNTTYSFQLQKTYEATYKDGKLQKAGGTNIGMPSLDWVFSDVAVYLRNETVCDNSDCSSNTTYCYADASFNITNTDANGRWSSFVLVNHIGLGNQSSLPESGEENTDEASNSTTNGVKIDFVITDYVWATEGDDVVFGLECSFTQSKSGGDNGNDTLTVEDGDGDQGVSYGNGFFSVNSTAYATLSDGNSTAVSVNLTSSGNTLEIVYSHFASGATLVHDPTLGVGEMQLTDDSEPNDLTALWIALGVVGGLLVIGAVVAVIVGGVVYMRRKQADYTSI